MASVDRHSDHVTVMIKGLLSQPHVGRSKYRPRARPGQSLGFAVDVEHPIVLWPKSGSGRWRAFDYFPRSPEGTFLEADPLIFLVSHPLFDRWLGLTARQNLRHVGRPGERTPKHGTVVASAIPCSTGSGQTSNHAHADLAKKAASLSRKRRGRGVRSPRFELRSLSR